MTAPEILAGFTAAGVPLRLAEDGTIRLRRVAAEAHPELMAELKAHKAEAAAILRGWETAIHPCIRCGTETAPEDLFCNVACFACWKAERAARRRQSKAGS